MSPKKIKIHFQNWFNCGQIIFIVVLALLVSRLEAASSSVSDSAESELVLANQMAAEEASEKVINAYKQIVKEHPFSKAAAAAQFQVAQLLKTRGDLMGSFKAYTYLLKKYPETPHFEEAVAEQIKIANAYLQGKRIKFLGVPTFTSMERAQEMYETILSNAPYSKYAALTQFNLGLSFERQGKAEEAIAAYQKLIDKYPTSDLCDGALYQIGYVYMRLGMVGKSQDLSALKEAHNSFEDFQIQYPNNEKMLQAHDNMAHLKVREGTDTLNIAHFYDFSKDYRSAAIYYNEVIRKFPQTADAKAAKTRLEELKAEVGEESLRSGQHKPQSGSDLA